MSYSEAITTTDGYQYLECPGTSRVTIQVSNAMVDIGFGLNPKGIHGGGQYPSPDEPYLPTVGGLGRQCDEIRVKSHTPGVPAQVFITAL